MRYEEYMKEVLEEYRKHGIIGLEEFPDMELYMDQAVLFLDRKLGVYKKGPKEPVVTKTMIGNYAKHRLIPRPVRKKYTKEHLLLLSLILHLKGILPMSEIALLMKPLVDNYESDFEEKLNIDGLYDGLMEIFQEKKDGLRAEVEADAARIKNLLMREEAADDDTIELFMLIAALTVKAGAEKYLAQKLLDEYFAEKKKA